MGFPPSFDRVLCDASLFYGFQQFSRVFHDESAKTMWKTQFVVEKSYQ